jgi:hypothetical protein
LKVKTVCVELEPGGIGSVSAKPLSVCRYRLPNDPSWKLRFVAPAGSSTLIAPLPGTLATVLSPPLDRIHNSMT